MSAFFFCLLRLPWQLADMLNAFVAEAPSAPHGVKGLWSYTSVEDVKRFDQLAHQQQLLTVRKRCVELSLFFSMMGVR